MITIMDLSFTEIVSIVPGLIYAVLVIMIYRDGAKTIDLRIDKAYEHHKEELDRLNAIHNARVEQLQTILETFIYPPETQHKRTTYK